MQPPDPIARRLARRRVLVLDGALATELERRGFDLRDELWSAKVLLERPDAIRDVHESYFEAGADVATTASYQATFQGFARRGLSHARAAGALELSVRLACEARDEAWARAGEPRDRERPLVAASVGSYGAFLADGSEYRGDYGLSEDQLAGFHRERVALLASSGADLLAFETVPCLAEARALSRLLRELPGARAWISFSCRDERHVSHGEPIAACAAELESNEQIVAIGVNCTAPRYVPGLVAELARSTRKPIAAYPNSGERYDAAARRWVEGPARADFAGEARRWIEAGARLVGGCCRTTPADIAAIAAYVATLAPARPGASGTSSDVTDRA
jgi:homocysteine S-methyltransferase